MYAYKREREMIKVRNMYTERDICRIGREIRTLLFVYETLVFIYLVPVGTAWPVSMCPVVQR